LKAEKTCFWWIFFVSRIQSLWSVCRPV